MVAHKLKSNDKETKRMRYEFVLDATHYHENGWKMIYIDEFSKNFEVKQHYAFSKKGEPKPCLTQNQQTLSFLQDLIEKYGLDE